MTFETESMAGDIRRLSTSMIVMLRCQQARPEQTIFKEAILYCDEPQGNSTMAQSVTRNGAVLAAGHTAIGEVSLSQGQNGFVSSLVGNSH